MAWDVTLEIPLRRSESSCHLETWVATLLGVLSFVFRAYGMEKMQMWIEAQASPNAYFCSNAGGGKQSRAAEPLFRTT